MRVLLQCARSFAMAIKLLLATGIALPAVAACAQAVTSPSPQPEFEAASIRLVDAHSLESLQKGIGQPSVSPFPANLFAAKFMSLSNITSIAYGIDGNRITDKPDWMDDQLYDISAKVDGDAMLTAEQMRPLLQGLLAQRFHLAAHRESKAVPGYALAVAKGGPKLQPSKDGDKPFFYILPNGLQDQAGSMSVFASMLERPAGRPVIDKTGVSGLYNIKVRYAPANSQKSDLPDFFTALQEQLGLKLVPQKVPVEYLVIDHVDRVPTEN